MEDTDYRQARDRLIPLAESYANEKVGFSQNPGVSRSDWVKKWGRTFLGRMDELAKKQGLVK